MPFKLPSKAEIDAAAKLAGFTSRSLTAPVRATLILAAAKQAEADAATAFNAMMRDDQEWQRQRDARKPVSADPYTPKTA